MKKICIVENEIKIEHSLPNFNHHFQGCIGDVARIVQVGRWEISRIGFVKAFLFSTTHPGDVCKYM